MFVTWQETHQIHAGSIRSSERDGRGDIFLQIGIDRGLEDIHTEPVTRSGYDGRPEQKPDYALCLEYAVKAVR